MGAVVRSTSLLPAIHRKYPGAALTWVTAKNSLSLLAENPLVDMVLSSSHEDLLKLRALKFDVAICVDKSLEAAGILKFTSYDELFGFTADSITGAIVPANSAAEELWRLGLDNPLKFFKNQKAETQLMHEAFELGPFQRDEYQLFLSAEEFRTAQLRREEWGQGNGGPIIGFNTGCSSVIPMKRWTVDFHRRIILTLQNLGFSNLVLLGGAEDEARNQEIAEGFNIFNSPSRLGLRDGVCSVEACDIVITGDSLGMHLAIARAKYVVAWFGPTCSQEIDLYDRGSALSADVSCGPCWKRSCQHEVMCYDSVSEAKIVASVRQGSEWLNRGKTLMTKVATNVPLAAKALVKVPIRVPNEQSL